MHIYLFTYHAYRSWNADHHRGFVQKGCGYLPPNPNLARAYDAAAGFPAFEFDPQTQRFLIEVSMDVCQRRGWQLRSAAAELTHLHDLVSWTDGTRWQDVRGKIKNIMSLELSRRAGTKGRAWFVEEASRRRVTDDGHLNYLISTYLPDHGGWRWDEARGWTPPRVRTSTPAADQALITDEIIEGLRLDDSDSAQPRA